MSEMDTHRALAIIACHVVRTAWRNAVAANDYGLWEDFPDIGEHDWADVVDRANTHAEMLAATPEEFRAAYAHLAARAGGEA